MKNHPQQQELSLVWPLPHRTKTEMIRWGFQAYFVGLVLVMFPTLSLFVMATYDKGWKMVVCSFVCGWQASKIIPPVWKKFMQFSLLRFPVMKHQWRINIRSRVTHFC